MCRVQALAKQVLDGYHGVSKPAKISIGNAFSPDKKKDEKFLWDSPLIEVAHLSRGEAAV